MALTYDESADLMLDMEFRGRIKVASLKYATYIMDEATSVPAHNTRAKWAANTMQQPDMTAAGLQPSVVMDASVQTGGKDIDDATLQSAVENVINKMM